ncbi:hypothetical protein DICPUDRAFT_98231 [Dictyostelium purpureum]|uniref:FNIP repeat-containing protein n=1 Tax=Dictyostelium purpureum TaxID=5786 RepID=F0ZNR2_DICPU|nr:uncharacterized protein DICPUDRAFT_98231 [Dictyostelium purpureum]EGC34420.1 hypothetical protein DICPUDRAFT_98231 [Dictyostelium purpureum]|eukprot:XP_003289049.1 hypothetical protein DICPUDRAFT_98231 [Dictyostelium purpureum]
MSDTDNKQNSVVSEKENTKSNVRDLDCLFSLVWCNIYIRKEIFRHVELYRKNYGFKVRDSRTLYYLPTKGYIKHLTIDNIISGYPIPFGVNALIVRGGGSTLDENSIPDSVTSLSLNKYSNIKFEEGQIPSSLTFLEVNRGFQQLNKNVVFNLNLLESLIIGDDFNLLEPNQIPSTVKTLQIGERVFRRNGELPKKIKVSRVQPKRVIGSNSIPQSVTQIIFGDYYNTSIKPNVLPSSVESITFGLSFNKPIGLGVLPLNLTSITFDYHFDQEIKPLVLPQTLRYLKFGFEFNQAIEPFVLPESLTTLIFGCMFNQQLLPGSIPNKVEYLRFAHYFNKPITQNDILPQSLKKLRFGTTFNSLNPDILSNLNIEELGFGMDFKIPIENKHLPPSLKILQIYNKKSIDLTNWKEINFHTYEKIKKNKIN